MAASRPSVALSSQVVLAAALPWAVGLLLGPEDRWWAVAVLAAVTVFALVNRALPRVWLLPLVAVVNLWPALLGATPWLSIAGGVLASGAAVAVIRAMPIGQHPPSSPARAIVGWTLVAAGVAGGALAVAATASSDVTFEAAQASAAEAWNAPLIGEPDAGTETIGNDAPKSPPAQRSTGSASDGDTSSVDRAEPPVPATTGRAGTRSPRATADPVFAPEPLARLAFARPGQGDPVTEQALYVGPNVTASTLSRGPGHYPTTAAPGAPGNFAVAGHRTGWGSPFGRLDDLRAGDRVRVTDRRGTVHTYVVERSEIVDPDATWVLGADPLGSGQPTMTLTTCDPPGVNDRRLVVFATLRG